MELTQIKYGESEKLPDWRNYFYRLGWLLAKEEFENTLIFVYVPYSDGLIPLITIGYHQNKIKRDFKRKIIEYEDLLEEKIREAGGEIEATYIWSGKRCNGKLSKMGNGFLFRTKGVPIQVKRKFILKINADKKKDRRFKDLDKDIKKLIERFYDVGKREYLSSIDPVKFKIWGTKKKIQSEFEREICTAKRKESGEFADLIGATGKRGGSHIAKFIVSKTSLQGQDKEERDIIIFDGGGAFLKGVNITKSKLKIVLVDSFDKQLHEAKRQFVNNRITSLSDIDLEKLRELNLPNGVELSGFKYN